MGSLERSLGAFLHDPFPHIASYKDLWEVAWWHGGVAVCTARHQVRTSKRQIA